MQPPKLRVTGLFLLGLCALSTVCPAQVNEVQKIADGVYFHQGDIVRRGHCNNGWIVFEDFVLVVDANYPSGAQVVIPKIKETSDRPIRFAFDTHHHGDHLYGNQVWVEQGATAVAHAGVLEELKKHETGLFGSKPGRWEGEAARRKDVADSKLKAPAILFNKDMIFEDMKQRVELLHFGVAHTRGDGFAWLPKERILFTGDAVVNGAYNFVGDGDTGQWIETLEKVKKLNPRVVCPGHGPIGDGSLVEDQQRYFVELRTAVKKLVDAGQSAEQVKAATDQIKTALQTDQRITRYIGGSFANQVQKVYAELTAKPDAAAR